MHRALLNFHAFSWETRPQGQKSVYGKQRPGAAAPSNGNQPVKENASEPNGCCGLPAPLWRMVLHPSAGRGGRSRRPGAPRGRPSTYADSPARPCSIHAVLPPSAEGGLPPPRRAQTTLLCGPAVLRLYGSAAKKRLRQSILQKNAAPRRKRFLPGRCVQLVHQNLKKGLSASSTASAGRAENGRIGSGLSPYGASGFSNQATSHHRPDL